MNKLLLNILLTLLVAGAVQAFPLSSLSATGQTRQVTLQWELSSAQPVARFDIARNGLNVAKLPAATSTTRYEWVDREVQHDREYRYTLVAVLLDGSREALGTVSATPAYDAAIVSEYKLHQNFPNPFNPETTIEVELAEDGPAVLTVYDILGQVVAKPFAGNFNRGRYSVLFSGRDLPSGVYVYQLEAVNFVDQKKMVLLK